MAAPDHNIFNNDHHYDPLDQWTCPSCFRNISSSRPPVFNADNCSCVENCPITHGPAQATQPDAYSPQGYQCGINAIQFFQPPLHSYPSSSASVPCPEGPEREDPNLHITNTYLPIVPDPGLNETEYRRSVSFHSDLPYQRHRYLIDQHENQSSYGVEPSSETRTTFLPQDDPILSQSKKKRKDRKRSKPSHQSFESSSSEEMGFTGLDSDLMDYTGQWIDERSIRYDRDGYGYPLTMSGMTECSDD